MGRRVAKHASVPTAMQVATTWHLVQWYLGRYYGRPADPGVLGMFCDPDRVGGFAVAPEAIRAGEPAALFRLLITVAMFQRQRDAQVSAILRGISRPDARELTSATRLVRLAAESGCPHALSVHGLRELCDLTKHRGIGRCGAQPDRPCALKRHTLLLRRYGHFGKMPTSAALVVGEAGAGGLRALYTRTLREIASPYDRALHLEHALKRIWRVSDKLAAMYLSALTNPDLSPGVAPWTKGIDWTYFVVVDSNVDLFLGAIGYRGSQTYTARREFIQAIASRIDLARLRPGLQPYNPRLVQQAMYLFMSTSNRRAVPRDCSREGPPTCRACPPLLRQRCALRNAPRRPTRPPLTKRRSGGNR